MPTTTTALPCTMRWSVHLSKALPVLQRESVQGGQRRRFELAFISLNTAVGPVVELNRFTTEARREEGGYR